jgi:membrane protease YdiL (CAAX protease family)
MPLSPNLQLVLWIAASAASLWLAWRSGIFALRQGGSGSSSKRAAGGKRSRKSASASPKPTGVFGRDVSGLPAAIWFVCAAAIFLSAPVGQGLAASLPPEYLGKQGSLQMAAVFAFASSSVAAIVGVVMLYLIQPRTSASAGTRFEARDLVVGAWCFVIAMPIVLLTALGANWFWTHILNDPPPDEAHSGLRLFLKGPTSTWGLLFALTAGIITPIAEEFMYRIFGQSSARALIGDTPARVWLSVLIVNGVFAASHAAGGGPVPWAAVPGLLMLSIAMGIAYEHTRRPGVPITMHALFNLGNLGLAWWQATHPA